MEFLISNSKLNRFTLEFLVEKLRDQPWPWPHIINTNLTSRGKKLLKLLISKTRLIKIFEVYRDKS